MKKLVTLLTADEAMDSQSNQHLVAGTSRLEQGIFDRRGIARKRTGHASRTAPASGAHLASWDGKPLAFGDTAEIWDEPGQAWRSLGTCKPYALASETLHPWIPYEIFDVDVVETSKVRAVVYTVEYPTSPPVWSVQVETFRKSTGARIGYETMVSATGSLKCFGRVLVGTTGLHCYAFNATGNFIHATIGLTGAIGTPAAIGSAPPLLTSYPFFDAEMVGADAILAYPGASSLARLTLLTNGITFDSAGYIGVSQPCSAISLCRLVDGTSVAVAWAEVDGSNNHPVFCAAYSDVSTATISRAQVGLIAGAANDIQIAALWRESNTAVSVFFQEWDSAGWPAIHQNRFSDSGGGTGAADITPGVATYWIEQAVIAGRPKVGEAVLPVRYTEFDVPLVSLQQALLFVAFDHDSLSSRSTPVGKALLGRHYHPTSSLSAGPINNVPGKWDSIFATVSRLRYKRDDGTLSTTYALALLDLEESAPLVVGGNDEALVSGACPYEIDGETVHEQGFLQYPERLTAVAGTATGGLASGYYGYRAVFEWTDARGRLHRSAPTPSPAEFNNGGAPNSCLITLRELVHTRKRGGLVARIYRTKVSASSPAPGPYYSVGTALLSGSGTESFEDVAADATIADNEILYTLGGVLEVIQPPPTSTHAIFGLRHIVADAEREGVLRYSKELEDLAAFEHSDFLELRVAIGEGAIAALAPLSQQTLAVFFARAIYVISGLGWSSTLQGANFSAGRLVTPTIGCSDDRSVLRLPDGLAFLASDGLYLLSPQLQITPIGEPIRDHVLSRTLAGAGVDATNRVAVWYFTDGTAVAWSWIYGKWSLWTLPALVSAAVVDGSPWLLTATAALVASSAYLDGSATYALAVETGWVALGEALSGFGRLFRLYIEGYKRHDHTLRVRVAYDGEPEWREDLTFDPAALSAFGPDAFDGMAASGSTYKDLAYQLEVAVGRSKCSKVKIRVEEVADGEGTAGWSLSAISALVSSKRGGQRATNGRKF